MDQEVVQRTRYVLRSRFRRAQSCPPALFSATCAQLVAWLTSHPVLAGHLHALRLRDDAAVDRIVTIGRELGSLREDPGVRRVSYDPGFYAATSLESHAAVCLAITEAVARDARPRGDEFLVRCLAEHLTGNDKINADDALLTLRDVALDGLFEHLDENLDSRNVILALIRKYRQRAEWFQRRRLRDLAAGSDGRSGERALADDLYEYLLDQTLEFFVEPSSGSGEVDVVLREPGGRYVVVDAKFVRSSDTPSEVKRKLASGVHQVARYCDDYQEPAGHLVIYSDSRRHLALDLEEADGWRFLRVGGRLIYVAIIWIADAPSASKLGKAEEVSISRAELCADVTLADATATLTAGHDVEAGNAGPGQES
ncbi:MAG: hypothetical protein V7645_3065 [Actinomycetota bacterium]|jgi:hypothetical protein